MSKYNIPEGLKYTESHEWILSENVGNITKSTCGITDYAQKTLSDIVYVELPQVGREVNAGEAVATLESAKAVSDVYSPIGGRIEEINEKVVSDPSIINKSPYTDGWLFKISSPQDSKNTVKLLDADEYKELIKKIEG